MNDIEELQSALIDLVDGNAWYDIVYNTGLSEERAKEIIELYRNVLTAYNKRHGI